MSVCSGSGIVNDSTSASTESNRHSSTRVACSEKIAKLTPTPSQVAPSGYGVPGHTRMFEIGTEGLRYHVHVAERNGLGARCPSALNHTARNRERSRTVSTSGITASETRRATMDRTKIQSARV